MADPKKRKRTLAKIQQETERDLFGPKANVFRLNATSVADLSESDQFIINRLIEATVSDNPDVTPGMRASVIKNLRLIQSQNPGLISGNIPSAAILSNARVRANLKAFQRTAPEIVPSITPAPQPTLTTGEKGELIGGITGQIAGGLTPIPGGSIIGSGIGGTVGRQVATAPPPRQPQTLRSIAGQRIRFPTQASQEREELEKGILQERFESFKEETGRETPEPILQSLAGGGRQAAIEAFFKLGSRAFRRLKGPTVTERTLAQPQVQLAERLGVELPLEKIIDSETAAAFIELSKRALGVQRKFQTQQLRVGSQIAGLLDDLAKGISDRSLGRREVGLRLGQAIDLVHKETGKAIGSLRKELGGSTTPFRLSQSDLDAFASLATQAEKLGDDVIAKEIKDIANITSVGEAIDSQLRLLQFQFRQGSAGGAAKGAKGEIKRVTERILSEAGFEDDIATLRSLETKASKIFEAEESAFIKSLAKFASPEAFASKLLSASSGQSAAEAAKAALGVKQLPNEVRRAIVEELHIRFVQEGVPISGVAERVVEKSVRPDTIRALLKKEEADFIINDLPALVDIADIPRSAIRPPGGPSLLGFGQALGVGAGAVSAAGDVSAMQLLASIGLLKGPQFFSSVVTARGGVELLKRASIVKIGTAEAGKLITKILALGLQEDVSSNSEKSLTKEP